MKDNCRPCAYFYKKADSCRQGDECTFCHLCPPDALKRKRKEKIQNLQIVERAKRADKSQTMRILAWERRKAYDAWAKGMPLPTKARPRSDSSEPEPSPVGNFNVEEEVHGARINAQKTKRNKNVQNQVKEQQTSYDALFEGTPLSTTAPPFVPVTLVPDVMAPCSRSDSSEPEPSLVSSGKIEESFDLAIPLAPPTLELPNSEHQSFTGSESECEQGFQQQSEEPISLSNLELPNYEHQSSKDFIIRFSF